MEILIVKDVLAKVHELTAWVSQLDSEKNIQATTHLYRPQTSKRETRTRAFPIIPLFMKFSELTNARLFYSTYHGLSDVALKVRSILELGDDGIIVPVENDYRLV